MAQGVDKAGIAGAVGGLDPDGILNTVGVGDVDFGSPDGGPVSWDKIVEMIKVAKQANAYRDGGTFLINAATEAKLMTEKKDAGSGIFLLDPFMGEGAARIAGQRVVTSENVPSNLTKGAGTDLSAIIYGFFSDIIIGQWGGLEVLVDPYTQGLKGATRYIINGYYDTKVVRPESFVIGDEVDNA